MLKYFPVIIEMTTKVARNISLDESLTFWIKMTKELSLILLFYWNSGRTWRCLGGLFRAAALSDNSDSSCLKTPSTFQVCQLLYSRQTVTRIQSTKPRQRLYGNKVLSNGDSCKEPRWWWNQLRVEPLRSCRQRWSTWSIHPLAFRMNCFISDKRKRPTVKGSDPGQQSSIRGLC